MSEKLFTFLVSFFAAVSNYFHCHCVLFSPIRARPSSIAIWIFTVSWLFTVQSGRLFGRCFLLLLFSHTPRTKFHRFFCVQHFHSFHATFFSLSSVWSQCGNRLGLFTCFCLVPLHCLMDSGEVFSPSRNRFRYFISILCCHPLVTSVVFVCLSFCHN